MALILSIDTALEEAAVCISENEAVLAVKNNSIQMDHAAWIQKSIKNLLAESEREIGELSAIAVTAGPGSYTGLRVGMATAKGMCYALGIPLITESTLYLLAQRCKKVMAVQIQSASPVLICPMIDARRMEVFTTLYDIDLNLQMQAEAMILTETSFVEELKGHVVTFCGNGSKKWQHLCIHNNAVFVEVTQDISDLAESASKKFEKGFFSDLAYTQPAYLKSVYTGNPSRLK